VFILLLSFIIILYSCEFQNNGKGNPEEPLRLLWEYPYDFKGYGPHSAPEVIHDSLIIMAGDENISCLYQETGKLKWKTKVAENNSASMRNILFNDNSLYGWQDRVGIMTWDIHTGKELWNYKFNDGDFVTRFTAISDHSYILPAFNDTMNWYWSFNNDGSINYKKRIRGTAWSITYRNNKLFTGQGWHQGSNGVGRITCFNSANGDSLWSYDTKFGGFFQVKTVIENGILYCGTVYGHPNSVVVALDLETGKELWTHGSFPCHGLLLEGNLLFSNSSLDLYAINKYNGEMVWSTRLTGGDDENNSIAYFDGYIYHPHSGYLFILKAETGEIVYKLRSPDKSWVYKVSTGAGKVFVQSGRHLYAYAPYGS